MNRNNLIITVGLAVAVIPMMTSSNQSIYASPTTEDDGWVEGDYEGSLEEQEEQAQEDWEDAGRPGEIDEDNDDGNDDNGDDEEQIFRCSDGSTVTGDEECPSTGPNLYCDQVGSNYHGVCHDRKDYSESTGLYPCNDGTQKKRWQDCKDATKTNNDSSNSNSGSSSSTETLVINPNSETTTANAADVSNCKLGGSADGIQQKFDSAKYQACKLHTNDRIYYDGFVTGCMQVGNTKLICETVADSSILNIETQPTQSIQPTAIN